MRFKKSIAALAIVILSHSSLTYCKSKKRLNPKKQIRVAVIDTGLDLKDPRFYGHICSKGNTNFVYGEPIDDTHGHGTHIAGLIQKYAEDSNYCLAIYKFYSKTDSSNINYFHEIKAIQKALDDGANIVNLSEGGMAFGEDESLMIKEHPEVTFVVAAGNDGKNLDVPGNYFYPASLFYGNIVPVGSITRYGNRAPTSNYSTKVKKQEIGDNVLSYLPNERVGYMSGTSQATAIYTGKLVKELSKQRSTNVGN